MNLHIKALNIAATGVIWFIVAITIWMELFPPLKVMLTAVTGQHWVTKGVFALALFAVLYGACAALTTDSGENTKPIYITIGSAVVGGLTIFGFFVWNFFAT